MKWANANKISQDLNKTNTRNTYIMRSTYLNSPGLVCQKSFQILTVVLYSTPSWPMKSAMYSEPCSTSPTTGSPGSRMPSDCGSMWNSDISTPFRRRTSSMCSGTEASSTNCKNERCNQYRHSMLTRGALLQSPNEKVRKALRTKELLSGACPPKRRFSLSYIFLRRSFHTKREYLYARAHHILLK